MSEIKMNPYQPPQDTQNIKINIFNSTYFTIMLLLYLTIITTTFLWFADKAISYYEPNYANFILDDQSKKLNNTIFSCAFGFAIAICVIFNFIEFITNRHEKHKQN